VRRFGVYTAPGLRYHEYVANPSREKGTAMTPIEDLRFQLLDLLDGGHAHMSLEQATTDFPMSRINERPPQVPYSPWALLDHIRRSQEDILRFIEEPDYESPPWPQGYWPAAEETVDEVQWEATLDAYRNDLAALREKVEDPQADLTGDFPHAPGYSLLREILLVSDHTAYHVGEFAILRQVMGTWPSERDV
jgi:hypothetical protein